MVAIWRLPLSFLWGAKGWPASKHAKAQHPAAIATVTATAATIITTTTTTTTTESAHGISESRETWA